MKIVFSSLRAACLVLLALPITQCGKFDDRDLIEAGAGIAGASFTSGAAGKPSGGAAGTTPGGRSGNAGSSGTDLGGAGDGGTGEGGDATAGTGAEGGMGPVDHVGCAPGQRDCLGSCIAEDACCGTAECPTGKSCIDSACTCNEGTKACGAVCIGENACCSEGDCQPGADCNDGTCSCPAGTHECPTVGCQDDTSPATCGTRCEPCVAPTGGTVTCVAGQCTPACPSGQKACAGACVANNVACGACPTGQHDCSGICLPNNSVNSCGTSCGGCPTPVNGTATCNGTACGFTCNANFKKCGNACIAATACCTAPDCPAGMACTGGQCVCPTGSKRCGSACIPNAGCCGVADCTDPANGSVACTGNQCVTSCDANYYGAACNYYFSGLGYPLPTHVTAEVFGVSGDGTTAVGWSATTNSNQIAARWIVGGASSSLAAPAGHYECRAVAASSNGSVLAGTCTASGDPRDFFVGVRWLGLTPSSLGLTEFGGFSVARAVSNDGVTIIGAGDNDQRFAGLRWLNGSVSTVGGNAMGDAIELYATSGDGLVWGGMTGSGTTDLGSFGSGTPGTTRVADLSPLTALGVLPGLTSGAVLDLNTNGTIAAGFLGNRAVRWVNGAAQNLGTLTGASRALAIDGSGNVIVGTAGTQPFIWDATNGMRALSTVLTQAGVNLAGWALTSATGISTNGRVIVGNATRGERTEPWVARFP